MAIPASPYSSVPQFLNRPAVPVGLGGAPGVSMGPSQPDVPGAAPEAREPDIVERLVLLMLKSPQFFVPWMAGLGFQRLLEKSGKFVEKPHRSNEELSQGGMDTGIAGQTGQPSPEQMTRMTMPQAMPRLGGMVGY